LRCSLRRADCADAHTAAGSRRGHRRDGAWAAAAQKDLKRVFAYFSINHLGYCMLGIFALAIPGQALLSKQPGAGSMRHPANVQSRHHCGALFCLLR